MIIEAKRRQSNSSNPRHVLCAESDEERDNWVDILIRHVTGEYHDDQQNLPLSSSTHSNGLSSIGTSEALTSGPDPAQPRLSTSSVEDSEQMLIPNKPRIDAARPTHLLLQEEGNSPSEAQFLSSLPSSSPLDSDGHTFSVPRLQSSLGHSESK